MNGLNRLKIVFGSLFMLSSIAQAHVVQDFESNDQALQEYLGWEFQKINFSSATNYRIYGNYSGATTSISASSPWAWIISPWVKVDETEVTLALKIDKGSTPRTYILSAYPYDPSKADGRGALVKIDSVSLYSDNSNTIIPVTFHLPASFVGKLYKFKYSFNGMVSAAKASVDALTYPGENYSDPTNGGLPKPEVVDTDKDGVPDDQDQYPIDPYRAYNNYYPAQGAGTLVFEDSWPRKGDYDLNDVVVDYSTNRVTNGANEVVEVKARFVMRASGANYQNGFGFQLDGIAPDKITSVSGCRRSVGSYIKDASNGLEQGQDYATCIVFDNFFNEMSNPGVGLGVNTEMIAPKVDYQTLDITLSLLENGQAPAGGKLTLSQFPSNLFNFFIIADKKRGVEVHLPDRMPTTLADQSLFNTKDDASVAPHYYRTANNLPWGLDIVQQFNYPIETVDVSSAYLHFIEWAVSSGQQYPDWYSNKPGYRDSDKIYSK